MFGLNPKRVGAYELCKPSFICFKYRVSTVLGSQVVFDLLKKMMKRKKATTKQQKKKIK